jgi:hypothetical protein
MNDFGFLFGSWNIANRRLATLFSGSDDWHTFPSTSICQPILNGGGNTEEIDFSTFGTRGFALRLFDVTKAEWSIYWSNSQTGILFPPVVGTFTDGRGDFYGDDTHEDKPIKAHYIWSDITPTSARWEQEFSPDGGTTWESNWTMEFTRA